MNRLGDSFHRVADEYDRGRPQYPQEAVVAMLDGLPETPDIVDVGAGTGQLAKALADAGAQVTAVEPGAETRRVLERRVSGTTIRIVDARGEELPVEDASTDLVVCADSFHWLDVDRALAEFLRVLRPRGRLVLSGLRPAWTPEQSGDWAHEAGAVLSPLWKRSGHPLRETGFRVPELRPDSGFTERECIEIPFVFSTDRDGLLALYSSWSSVASLPDAEQAGVRARLAEILERHAVGDLELTYIAQLRVYERG
jgi:SAM-dependent methyltransferase